MNDLTITQIANIVNEAIAQAGGSKDIALANTKDFVSVAQTALLTGDDNLAVGLSQVLAKTIFAVRPYNRTMAGIQRTESEWGNHVRKVNFLDDVAEDDLGYPISVSNPSPGTIGVANGNSVDQYVINLPKVLQTNFYGSATYDFHRTFSREQLRRAFQSQGEFSAFVGGVMLNDTNQREQRIDALSRLAVANFMAAKIEGDSDNVIKLVTVYNSIAGTSLTSETVRQPENFSNFAKWMYGYVKTVVEFMGQRSYKYHMNLTAGNIARQSTPNYLHMYMLAGFENDVDSRVLADIYHDDKLKFIDHERIPFWQAIESPDSITVNCAYTGADGTVKNSTSGTTTQDNIIGVIFDRDAIGYSLFDESSNTTPFNARGRYYNVWYNWQGRYYNDITENGIVLVLE